MRLGRLGFKIRAARSSELGRDQEPALPHDLFFASLRFQPDIEAQANYVDVRAGVPGCAGVLTIRVAEGDMDAGEFFVLQNIANHALNAEIGANGELANPV